jgi:hypothetical protein
MPVGLKDGPGIPSDQGSVGRPAREEGEDRETRHKAGGEASATRFKAGTLSVLLGKLPGLQEQEGGVFRKKSKTGAACNAKIASGGPIASPDLKEPFEKQNLEILPRSIQKIPARKSHKRRLKTTRYGFKRTDGLTVFALTPDTVVRKDNNPLGTVGMKGHHRSSEKIF